MARRNRFILILVTALGAAALLAGGTVWAVTAATPDDTRQQPQDSDPPTVPDALHNSSGTADSDNASAEDTGQDTVTSEEALALEAAEIMTTWTPGEDFNQTASELRARDLMTNDRAADVVAPNRPAGGEEWRVAAERNATSDPTVELNPHTENSRISVTATWRWVADGYNPIYSDQRRAFYFTFTEENGELKIYDYTWETLN